MWFKRHQNPLLTFLLKCSNIFWQSWITIKIPCYLIDWFTPSHQWKAIIHDLLEEKCLKRKFDGCPKVNLVEKDTKKELVILCPSVILERTGNPFPSSSLNVTNIILDDLDVHTDHPYLEQLCHPHYHKGQKVHLEKFISKFGNHLTSLALHGLITSSDVVVNILRHLTNLKTLTVSPIHLTDEEYRTLPELCNLNRLELTKNGFDKPWPWGVQKELEVTTWFFSAYSNQLKKLELNLRTSADPQQIPGGTISEHGGAFNPFGNLEELEITGPIDFFRCRISSPPLKLLIIKGPMKIDAKSLMLFIQKFSRTLERLDLDFEWNNLLPVDLFPLPERKYCLGTVADKGKLFQFAKCWVVQESIIGRPSQPNEEIRNRELMKIHGELLSIPIPKDSFQNLKCFSVAYPNADAESRIIKEVFLVKYPALEKLRLILFGGIPSKQERVQMCYERMRTGVSPLAAEQYVNERYNCFLCRQAHKSLNFLCGVDYWKFCSGLKRISVVVPQETGNAKDFVSSITKDEKESANKA
ncbi:unnamed protein product [Orchesella dallaii]|uniref:Uncharacterized protein n=1 Tax=Orchesella dallaii TaxID=48710 RepID=A0ABP1QVB9_9HEXA